MLSSQPLFSLFCLVFLSPRPSLPRFAQSFRSCFVSVHSLTFTTTVSATHALFNHPLPTLSVVAVSNSQVLNTPHDLWKKKTIVCSDGLGKIASLLGIAYSLSIATSPPRVNALELISSAIDLFSRVKQHQSLAHHNLIVSDRIHCHSIESSSLVRIFVVKTQL